LDSLLIISIANHSKATRRSISAKRESSCRWSRTGSTLSSIKSGSCAL